MKIRIRFVDRRFHKSVNKRKWVVQRRKTIVIRLLFRFGLEKICGDIG